MAPRKHGQLATEEELNDASWEGARGAVNGAARWGMYFAGLAGVFYAVSPVYRGLTVQFKIFISGEADHSVTESSYLQMSGMTIGSMIEADRRLRDYEVKARARRRAMRDHAMWRRWEEDLEAAGNQDAVQESRESQNDRVSWHKVVEKDAKGPK